MIKRREFIAGVAGAAVWPLATRAQQGDRVRRITVLMALDESDAASKPFLAALTRGLSELGWTNVTSGVNFA